MQHIHHPAIEKAHQHLHALSGDEQAWILALQRERTLSMEATVRGALERAERARIEAEAKGHAEGHKKGQITGQTALLRRLLRAKFGELPSSVDNRLQAAEPAQLAHWADRILFAETLEQVFSQH